MSDLALEAEQERMEALDATYQAELADEKYLDSLDTFEYRRVIEARKNRKFNIMGGITRRSNIDTLNLINNLRANEY